MKKLIRRLRPWSWWILSAISCGILFMLTAFQTFTGEHTKLIIQHITGMSEYSAYLTNAIIRKSAHVLIFGFLATLFYRAIRKRSIWYAWFCTALIAASDEWHQSFVPGRTPSIQDVMLDSLAAFLFLMGIAILMRRYSEQK